MYRMICPLRSGSWLLNWRISSRYNNLQPLLCCGTEESFEIYPDPVVGFSFEVLKSASSRMPSFDVRQSFWVCVSFESEEPSCKISTILGVRWGRYKLACQNQKIHQCRCLFSFLAVILNKYLLRIWIIVVKKMAYKVESHPKSCLFMDVMEWTARLAVSTSFLLLFFYFLESLMKFFPKIVHLIFLSVYYNAFPFI